ncbi:SWIM zinc finger family protein [Streptomyces sp. HMX87]|uniref:SWIM zinc finger family protein n=1 Tax=Streptomyces sp. HMX87 TaxID=3390849 RepID=UPI003A870A33
MPPPPTGTATAGDRGAPAGSAAPRPDDALAGRTTRTPSADGPPGESDRRAARPGDVAREALRAARRRARATHTDAPDPATDATEHPARAARSTGPASRPAPAHRPRTDGPRTPDARARALREMLTDAFRLPPDPDAAPTTHRAPDGADAPNAASAHRAPDRGAEPESRSAAHRAPHQGEAPRTAPPHRAADRGDGADTASTAHRAPDRDGAPDTAFTTHRAPDRDGAPDTAFTTHRAPDRDGAPDTASTHRTPYRGDGPDTASVSHPAPGRGDEPDSVGATAGAAQQGRAPAAPRTPRSMAAPGRDGELRRTFPAFPSRTAAGEELAETWWGNAWVTALEDGALDPERLARGRGYAERGHVDAITVTPGLVLAYVQGSRPRPYRVQVRLRTLDDADWERFLDAAAERPGHIAALLDKELPHSLAHCGVPLLPGPGDLAPRCSCPDSGHPCKHAAALCYQTARLLDADPFVLLLLRGRGERELLDALSRLSAARAARAAAQDRPSAQLPGVRASDTLAAAESGPLPPLPPPLPAPPHPEQPPAHPGAPGGPDAFVLDQLATDAAARAHAMLTTGRDPVGGLTLWQDAVRLAAARPGSGLTAGSRALYAALATATGRSTADLARAVAAWRQGGPAGLAVLEEAWDPPAGRFDRARPLLLAADLPAFRPWRNRLTHPQGHVQLRLGRDGLWYAYESEPGREDWWPRGTPDLDPVGALTGLGTPGDL